MFVLGLVFQRMGREQMVLSSLEGFVRMCRSRHERAFKEDTKGRESELGKVPTTWAEGMAMWEGSVSHTWGV